MKSSTYIRVGTAVGMLSMLLLLVVLAILTYNNDSRSGIVGYLISHHLLIMVLLVLVSLLTGAVLVVMLTQETVKQQKMAAGTAELLLTFLSADEKTTIDHLVRNDGSALQSQLSSTTGFSAVKMHRMLLRLQSKRFITLERYGKTNKVLLNSGLRAALVSSGQH